MQEKNLKPYNTTLARVSIECSKALELDLSEALLEQISKFPFAGPFNVFLAACDATVCNNLWTLNVLTTLVSLVDLAFSVCRYAKINVRLWILVHSCSIQLMSLEN